MNKEFLIKSNWFNDIDIHFANFVCKNHDDFNLWLLAAFVSFSSNNGHSAFEIKMVSGKKAIEIFDIDKTDENHKTIIPEIEMPENNSAIGVSGEMKAIIEEDGLFYLNRYYQYEMLVSEFIKYRTTSKDISSLKDEINKLFPKDIIEGQPNWQKVAAIIALRSNFAVISGGPGTGKTTTVGKILALLLTENKKMKIKLVAPTGKAADRLKESIINFKKNKENELIEKSVLDAIPEEAETIHRFIGINSKINKLGKDNKSQTEVLLIDEASMVSISLFAKTFEALKDNCKVILLGDKDQLTPVENGNVLKDITNSEYLNLFSKDFTDSIKEITNGKLTVETEKSASPIKDLIVQLKHSYRFDKESFIGNLSAAVNNADINDSNEILEEKLNEIFDTENKRPKEINLNEFIKEFYSVHLKEYKEDVKNGNPEKAIETLNKFRILCAINETEYGLKGINEQIEKLFTKENKQFYNGRPIIMTKNDYKLNLMNGDIGIILKSKTENILKAYFPNKTNKTEDGIAPASLGEHTTAFALSIHKSQGSEFDKVHIILPKKENKVLSKELIYTAITRAKKECTIYSTTKNLIKAIKQDNHRTSGLTKRLQ